MPAAAKRRIIQIKTAKNVLAERAGIIKPLQGMFSYTELTFNY